MITPLKNGDDITDLFQNLSYLVSIPGTMHPMRRIESVLAAFDNVSHEIQPNARGRF